MKIQNAPLSPYQLSRIQTYILGMHNKTACKHQTGIDTRTIHTIIKRGWANTAHLKKLMDYCDGVERFATQLTAA